MKTTNANQVTKIEEAFTSFPQLTLRQVAIQTDCTYNVLLREARKPIAGQIYDPEAINYDAIEKAMIRKLGQAAYDEIDFEAIAEKLDVREARQTDWNVGDKVSFRNFGGNYEILMKTATHLVFMEIDGSQPRVMSFDTFNHQGPKAIRTNEEEA